MDKLTFLSLATMQPARATTASDYDELLAYTDPGTEPDRYVCADCYLCTSDDYEWFERAEFPQRPANAPPLTLCPCCRRVMEWI